VSPTFALLSAGMQPRLGVREVRVSIRRIGASSNVLRHDRVLAIKRLLKPCWHSELQHLWPP
jgi:hypothetical protein